MSSRLRADKHAIEVRQAEAKERNAAWRKLSVAEKIASLRSRRGESKRQMKKLTAETEAQK